VTFFLEKAYSASLYFFLAALPGASTISMVRPSRAGLFDQRRIIFRNFLQVGRCNLG
jgi:hypothetical protein